MEATKVCTKCGVEKPVGEFRVMHNACNKCDRIRCKEYKKANNKKIALQKKDYIKKNREKIKLQRKEYSHNFRINNFYVRKSERRRESIACKNLSDSYLRSSLRKTGITNPTPEIIELKRQEITLHRALKKATEVLKNGPNAKTISDS